MLHFFIGNGPRRQAICRSCFSVPDGSNLELLGYSSKSAVLPRSSVQMHHSSAQFCTIRQYWSAPFISTVLHHSSLQFCTICQLQFCSIRQFSSVRFVSSVLHHSLATILHHVIMHASILHQRTILLPMRIHFVDYLTASRNISYCDCCLQNISPYLSTHLLYCRDSASLTSFKSMFCCPSAELQSILSTIDTWSSPFG